MEDLVLLHGFAGTGAMFDALRPARYRCHAPDLRGHGGRADARPVTWEASVADVLDAAPPRFALLGYSLGGRLAQHVALAAPERIARLVLVATQPGIEDPGLRAQRAADDEALAQRTEAGTIEQFRRAWTAQALFAGTPPDAARIWDADILRNAPAGLAASLRGMGTATMQLWDRLGELTMPVDVVSGQRDAKFTAIARRMAAALPDARLTVVPGAGHGLPRERPDALTAVVDSPLSG